MEMLRAPWNLQEGYHIPICLYQPMWLCQLWIVTINCYLSWSSVEAFIRWGISVEALIRWSLAVEALSVEANIRWCIHPLMHISVDVHIRWWMLSVEALQSHPLMLYPYPLMLAVYQLTLLHLYKITRHDIFTIDLPICISTNSQHDLCFAINYRDISSNTETEICYKSKLISK